MTIRHYTASAVVLDDHERVLLVHHNKIGLWLYPGGHIDPNEDPAQAAVREVAEETGIKAEAIGTPNFRHPAVQSHPSPWTIIEMGVSDKKVGAHRHIDLVYVCRPVGGDLSVQLEDGGDGGENGSDDGDRDVSGEQVLSFRDGAGLVASRTRQRRRT
jgi:8-oxo-dGTP diphosphatase